MAQEEKKKTLFLTYSVEVEIDKNTTLLQMEEASKQLQAKACEINIFQNAEVSLSLKTMSNDSATKTHATEARLPA